MNRGRTRPATKAHVNHHPANANRVEELAVSFGKIQTKNGPIIVHATTVVARRGLRRIDVSCLPRGETGSDLSGNGPDASMRAAIAPMNTRTTGNAKGSHCTAESTGMVRVRNMSPAKPPKYTTTYVIQIPIDGSRVADVTSPPRTQEARMIAYPSTSGGSLLSALGAPDRLRQSKARNSTAIKARDGRSPRANSRTAIVDTTPKSVTYLMTLGADVNDRARRIRGWHNCRFPVLGTIAPSVRRGLGRADLKGGGAVRRCRDSLRRIHLRVDV
jgi:hypothetical protein